MRYTLRLSNVLAATLGGLALLATFPASAIIMASEPNAALPDGSPGFNLVGTSLPAVQLPAVQFLIGFNPQNPTGTPLMPTLDLGDGTNPIIYNPDTNSSFSIFWGIQLPAVQFNTTNADGFTYPPSPCSPDLTDTSACYDFSAHDGNNNTFDIKLAIAGATAIDTASWVTIDAGTPDLPAVQFNFDFMAPTNTTLTAGDPLLMFSVAENGNPLSFSVPEPSTLLLMVCGLMGLVVRKSASRPFMLHLSYS